MVAGVTAGALLASSCATRAGSKRATAFGCIMMVVGVGAYAGAINEGQDEGGGDQGVALTWFVGSIGTFVPGVFFLGSGLVGLATTKDPESRPPTQGRGICFGVDTGGARRELCAATLEDCDVLHAKYRSVTVASISDCYDDTGPTAPLVPPEAAPAAFIR